MISSRIRNLFTFSAPRTSRKPRQRTRLFLEPLEDRRLLATIVVNNATDSPVTGQTNLRQAITQAASGDTITFSATVFKTLQTITLGGTQLEIDENLTIDGPSAGVTISGGNSTRVLQIDSGVTTTISSLTITAGKTGEDAGSGNGILNSGTANLTDVNITGCYAKTGGGLLNQGTANLTNCNLTGNGGVYGGSVYNSGKITLTDVTISGSSAGISGGGIDNTGTASFTSVTISGNSSGRQGGGVWNSGTANFSNSTISGSSALFGAGMFTEGLVNLIGCTISGNSAGSSVGGVWIADGPYPVISTGNFTNCTISGNEAYGGAGGLDVDSVVTLTDVTVSGNSAPSAAGMALEEFSSATLINTIVADQTNGGTDIASGGGGISGTNNLIGDGDGQGAFVNGSGGNIVGSSTSPIDPLLAPLGNYGGPTQTMPLLPGSPAIAKGVPANVSGKTTVISTDQRGAHRATSGAVDIGAFQNQGYTVALTSGSGQSTPVTSAFAKPLVATLTENFVASPLSGASLTFSAPASGASTKPDATSATTGANGQARVTPTANDTVGSYTVKASATGVATKAAFSLTNTAPFLVSITLTPATPSVAKGLTDQFTATGVYNDDSTKNLTSVVKWTSSNTTAASITTAGLATAKAIGSSTIKATDGAVVGSTVLTVTPAVLVSVALTPASPSVAKGLTEQFTATGTYTDGTKQTLTSVVTWASSNTTAATITTAGLATAKTIGTSTIKATDGAVVGSTVLTVAPAALVSIAVTPANPSVAKGLTKQFTATGTFTDGTKETLTSGVTWTSSNATAASITTAGLATAKAIGTATIKATDGAVVGSITLTVTPATLVSLAVTPVNSEVAKGLTSQFTATGTYTDSTKQNLSSVVTWASSNTTAASINTTGLLTAKSTGISTIKATDGAISASTTVAVTPAALLSITVTPANPSIAKGLTEQFTATGTYTDGTKKNLTSSVTWASSNSTAATISTAGLATAKATGASTIKATDGTLAASTTLTVTPAALTSIALTPASLSLAKGLTEQFTATGTYTDGTKQDLTTSVTWASSNMTAATISSAGLATALATGTSTITAVDGSIKGSTTLSVAPAAVVSIVVTPANGSLASGLTEQFTASGTFTDGTTQDITSSVTWASSNAPVASISTSGLTTALATGGTAITATDNGVLGLTTLIVTPAALVSIALTSTEPSLAMGLTEQFTATGTYTDGTTQDLTNSVVWSSSDTTAASISTTGLATALSTGTPTIAATDGSVFGSTTLTVTPAALVSIALTPDESSLAMGLTEQFTATGTFTDGTTQDLTGSVDWSSSDTTAASISTTGLATALSTGTPTIAATDGSVFGTTTLTVTPAALVSIALTPDEPSLAMGLTEQFSATGTYTDGTTQDLTDSVAWSSSDTTVATISTAGLATALLTGTSTITATDNGVLGTTTLTVTPAALVSIALTPDEPSLAMGLTEQFSATGTYTDGTTQDLTSSVAWSSSDTTAASISTTGLATALLTGTSTITATDNGVLGTTTLTVTPAALVSIALTPDEPSLATGLTEQFTATGTYTDGTTQDLTGSVVWSSSDTTVATISTSGLATALLSGTSTITATDNGVLGTTTIDVTPITDMSLPGLSFGDNSVKGDHGVDGSNTV